MHYKALVLAVAAMLAVVTGGVVAADAAGPDTAQDIDQSDSAYDTRLTADESFSTHISQENMTVVEDRTKLTADESFSTHISQENMTVVEDWTKLTADESFSMHIPQEDREMAEHPTRLTVDESIQLNPAEDKVTVEQQYDQRLTAEESFQINFSDDVIKSLVDGIYRIDLAAN
ncbi:hypothetical protein [Natrinema marinum]|uniref:hypothetical protein n=1 Tax=Natrinema marinum TaxID=2961598 RepID=UPI0020C89167|nr:hypothetical protein [Natrinema marinum]